MTDVTRVPLSEPVASIRTRVTLLAGGVGGARLAHGLLRAGVDLTVIVNTGDDAELHGLHISPDVDTVTYTLAGLDNPSTGWGVRGETFHTLEALHRLGEDTWFQLGDTDMATHIARTARLGAGEPLSRITAGFAAALGIQARILPMTDDRVATLVDTPAGRLGFQEYFVARQHRDAVVGLTYDGAGDAAPAPGVQAAIADADLLMIAPSNPLLSVAPILAVPGIRAAVESSGAHRIAVSPIIAGKAVKGPAAEVLESQGHEVSALGVARIYAGLVDRMVIDDADAALAPAIEALGMAVSVTNTVMESPAGRERLGRELADLP